MGNAVDFAINHVMTSDIDDYMLKLAFENPNRNFRGNWYSAVNQTTVAQGIREKVVHSFVLPACNVTGGKTEHIDLSSSVMRDLGNGNVEVCVPDVITGGRHIVSVVEVYLGSMTSATGMLGNAVNDNTNCGLSTESDMMQGLIDGLTSNRSMPITYTNVHMTGNNIFTIFGLNAGTMMMSAKVVLEYDSGMSSIHPRHYIHFAHLVYLATKSYIYRSCRRPTDEAVLRSGIALESIREDINEMRDAFKDYLDFFNNEWTRYMAYSDAQRVYDATRASVPRRM
jgi:hypothetical protein